MNEPSWRKPAGALAILALIALWAVLIASAAPWIGALNPGLQAIVYLVTGLVWIAPLKPLLHWTETGHWR